MTAIRVRFHTRRMLVWGVVLLPVIACASGGGTVFAGAEGSPVPLPSSATAPPQTVKLATIGLTNGEQSVTSGGQDITINLSARPDFALWADAQDSEGLQSVQIWLYDNSFTCIDPNTNLGRNYDYSYGRPQAQNTDSTPNPTQGYPERTTIFSIHYESCPGTTLKFQGGSEVFFAVGINYSGLSTQTPTITINYS